MSREADKITQLEARTRAYGCRKRIYLECTVSTEEGRTWREYVSGTRSRIVLPCPHCAAWVSPEREHLRGWQEAESQTEARAQAEFACPECLQVWSNDQRVQANRDCRLIHAGQSFDAEGSLTGNLPPTDTLGFRWSAVNNLFLTAGDVAADEWRATHSTDEENAERELRQFVWCLPVAPTKWEDTALDVHELASRMVDLPRGVVPESAQWLTAGVDLGKYVAHWIVVAWSDGAAGHIIDYGRLDVASMDLGVERAILTALREFHDLCQEGWPVGSAEDDMLSPQAVWVDAGYMTHVVYAFCRESGEQYKPAIGRGAAQQHRQWYNRPTRTGSVVKQLGEGYHLNKLRAEKLLLAEVDADHWKTWAHQRLSTPLDQTGAMTLFQTNPAEHLTLAKHLTAERKTEEFVTGKGVVVKWERIRRQNHFLDALYNACAAGHYAGARLVQEPKPEKLRVSLAELAKRARGTS
jgi:phage terminase large subunit GpA-like protein